MKYWTLKLKNRNLRPSFQFHFGIKTTEMPMNFLSSFKVKYKNFGI